MLGTQDLLLFVISGLLLNMTPGADTLYILGRSATQGARGGCVAALGIGAGCLIHIAAATIGLSALITTSAMAFTVVKFIGAGYLVYMGVSLLRSRSVSAAKLSTLPVATLKSIFWQGFLTNVLNPKVALFFLAFLPQFIAPEAQHKSLAMLFLGVIFNVNGTLWNLLLAWASAKLATQLKLPAQVSVWLNRSVGAVFVYFGVKLAFSQR